MPEWHATASHTNDVSTISIVTLDVRVGITPSILHLLEHAAFRCIYFNFNANI